MIDRFLNYDLPSYDESKYLLNKRALSIKLREEYITQIGFVFYTKEVIDLLSDYLLDKSNIVEIGAGTGYLSKLLLNKGINLTPVDSLIGFYHTQVFTKYHTEILKGDGIDYVKVNNPNVVILSWPDYESDFAAKVVECMSADAILIYQGESCGGCTADYDFFNQLDNFELQTVITELLDEYHIPFFGMHDEWEVYKKLSPKV